MKQNTESDQFLDVREIKVSKNKALPDFIDGIAILPTRELVLFPGVMAPVGLARQSSIDVAEYSEKTGKYIGIVCQKDASVEEPNVSDLYNFGVVAQVVKIFDLPDGTKTAILRARDKFEIICDAYRPEFPGRLNAQISIVKEPTPRKSDEEFIALAQTIKETAIDFLKKGSNEPNQLEFNLQNMQQPVMIVNMVASQMPIDTETKMRLLEENHPKKRAFKLLQELHKCQEMMDISRMIDERTRESMTEQQRFAFLSQQMEVIRKELYGDDEDDAAMFRKRAEGLVLPEATRKIFNREIDKISRLNPQSPDYAIQYSYLDLITSLPWSKYDPLSCSLLEAEDILNADHYGLEKVKDRILEQLAVLMNTPDGRAPILCLVGPPGVGKTSLGQSIAKALGRQYQRVSLGGLHDESEIRGHRRTYIGAMPGRIIDAMRRAGSSNPVLLLDEIDKMGNDIKGDPAAALLEVLDPEQNHKFHDNYVDVDFDLSKVFFIATANSLSTLPQALLDRMEIIELSGYLMEEKVEIATRHLLPRALSANNFTAKQFNISRDAIAGIVEGYTSESGVRHLERKVQAVVRKAVRNKVSGKRFPKVIKPEHLKEYLGVAPYQRDRYEGNDFAGVVTGLAWTAAGGEILFVEASPARGSGQKLTLTGNLGNVMKESATIALQYVKANADKLSIKPEIFEQYALHIHVPEGAIPKDGPSAGVTMATAIVSALTRRKVRERIAMTGEITLRGKVLPVGGIKEKILAAKRAGINTIILSEDNRKDVEDIPQHYLDGLDFVYVKTATDVFSHALLDELADEPLSIAPPTLSSAQNNIAIS